MSAGGLFAAAFEGLLEIGERAEARALELADPPLRDLVDRNRIDEMKLLPAPSLRRDQIRRLEDHQMLGHRLSRHRQSLTEFAQRLAVVVVQPVQQASAA